jgi:hypothetical protein
MVSKNEGSHKIRFYISRFCVFRSAAQCTKEDLSPWFPFLASISKNLPAGLGVEKNMSRHVLLLITAECVMIFSLFPFFSLCVRVIWIYVFALALFARA